MRPRPRAAPRGRRPAETRAALPGGRGITLSFSKAADPNTQDRANRDTPLLAALRHQHSAVAAKLTKEFDHLYIFSDLTQSEIVVPAAHVTECNEVSAGLDTLGIPPYDGNIMGPFTAADASLPFVEFMATQTGIPVLASVF